MNDAFMVIAGLGMIGFAALCWVLYLMRRGAMLLDAISLFYLGFIVWIGMGFVLVGVYEPPPIDRQGRYLAVLAVVLGFGGYLVGLAFRGVHLWGARILPTPTDNLTLPVAWAMLVLCLISFVSGLLLTPFLPPGLGVITGSLATTGLGGAGLLAVLLMTAYRGAIFNKLMGIGLMGGVIAFLSVTSFSRRPIPAMLGTLVAMVYHLHVRHRRLAQKAMFLGSAAGGIIMVILFLTAMRGALVKGREGHDVFSAATQRSLVSGLTINVVVLEYAVTHYPEFHSYLWGSGMSTVIVWPIPRAIWPGKPLPSGGVISRQYLGEYKGKQWSVAVTLIGEAFMNFGWIGLPFVMMGIGWVVGSLNCKLHQNTDNLALWAAWFVMVPDFMSEWRGDLTSMTVQAFLRVFFFLSMAWIFGKIFARRATQPPPAPGAYPIPAGGRPQVWRPGVRI